MRAVADVVQNLPARVIGPAAELAQLEEGAREERVRR
jgi:hypothetical protein